MPMLPFRGQWPSLGDRVFIANGAQVVGDVTIGDTTNIWYNAVLRGDMAAISVGAGCSIQDGCVVHVDHDMPTFIGNHVVVGHNAIIHGATVGDHVLVGMNATVLSEANIGVGSIIGAGAVVPERRTIPPRSLVLGIPRQGGARSDRRGASGRRDTRPALRRLRRRAPHHPRTIRLAGDETRTGACRGAPRRARPPARAGRP